MLDARRHFRIDFLVLENEGLLLVRFVPLYCTLHGPFAAEAVCEGRRKGRACVFSRYCVNAEVQKLAERLCAAEKQHRVEMDFWRGAFSQDM